MLIQAIPLFQDAHILRRTMLEALSDYAFLTNQFLYKGYSDGVLAGCELTTTEDTITLNEGVLFYEGQMFLIKKPLTIEYYPTNTTRVLAMHFSDEMRDANFIYRELELILTEHTEPRAGEVELGRFKLQQGAKLRYEYQSFEDRETEFDTLNQIYAPFSARGESTLNPAITRAFARELLAIETISDFDALCGMQFLNQTQPICKETLLTYLRRSRKIELEETSNLAIYHELCRILREEKYGVTPGEKRTPKKRWQIMID